MYDFYGCPYLVTTDMWEYDYGLELYITDIYSKYDEVEDEKRVYAYIE